MSKKKSSKNSKKKALAKQPFNLKKSFTDFWSNRSPAIRFLSIFAGCMLLFYAFYFSNIFVDYFRPPIVGTQAYFGSLLINLFGESAASSGSVIAGEGFSLDISHGCDGLEVTAILVAGILAFPALLKYKWKGILVGTIILAVLNLFRFPVLYFTGMNGHMELFDFLHIQGGFIIFVSITIVLWVFWMNWATKSEAEAELDVGS